LKSRGWGKGQRKKIYEAKKKTLFRLLFLFYVLNGQIIRKLK